MEPVEHLDDGQPMDRRLRIRPELDGAGAAPAFMHDHLGEAPGGELADGRAAVDVIDGLEIDVFGEIEMAGEARERVAPLLVGERSGDHVDAVPADGADDQVATILEPRLASLLRLPVHLAAMGDADIGGQEQVGRIGAGEIRRGQPAADRDVQFAVRPQPFRVVHLVDVGEHHVAHPFERRR